jgi:hypothetical protein
LNAKQDFSFVTKAPCQTLSHGVEVLFLLQRISEKLAQFRVNGVWVIVAQKSEAGVDLLLEQFAIDAREGREDLNERGQEVWALDDSSWFALNPAEYVPALCLEASGESKRTFESTLHAPGAGWRRNRFHLPSPYREAQANAILCSMGCGEN